MFHINVRTDEELESVNNFELLKEGEYELTIKSTKSKISGSGNDTLGVILSTNDGKGIYHHLTTMTLSEHQKSNSELVKKQLFMDYMNKKFFESFGIQYVSPVNTALWIGLKGKANIIIKKGDKKENSNDFYPDKNVIKSWTPKNSTPSIPSLSTSQQSAEEAFNDEIQF